MNKNIKEVSSKKQLIVIGNGFDFQCGLKTTYDDFFNNRFGLNLFDQQNLSLKDEDKIVIYEEFKGKILEELQYVTRFNVISSLENLINNFLKRDLGENSEILKNIEYIRDTQSLNLNKWEVIALASYVCISTKSSIKWNDVETMIYHVVTWILTERPKHQDSKTEEIEKSFSTLFKNYTFNKKRMRM